MLHKFLKFLSVPTLLFCWAAWSCWPSNAPKVDLLIDQFHGSGYHFNHSYVDGQDDPATAYQKFWASSSIRNYDFHKRIVAAEMLAEMRPSEASPAIPYLVDALVNGKNDYDSGDGIYPYRSTIARTLGTLRDERAIDPLIEKLKHPEKGNVPLRLQQIPGRSNPNGVGLPAIVEAIGKFGPKANHAASWLRKLEGDFVDSELKRSIEITLRRIGASSSDELGR